MSIAALEEVSVLSSIYCAEGEFRLVQQSAQDGLIVEITCTCGGDGGLKVSVVFHLRPSYPSHPPDVSISAAGLTRSQCLSIRQKLLDRAATLPAEPMLHQLLEHLQQCEEVTQQHISSEQEEREKEEEWTSVLLLDHIRSLCRYTGLLERWTKQLQLASRLLLGQNILVILQGTRQNIKEFCHRIKTVKVDVDSSGKKCKERMMKVLVQSPSSSVCQQSFQGFALKNYCSAAELGSIFQELNLSGLHQQLLPSLSV